jgi:excinuclease UvrABC nuclease subunit
LTKFFEGESEELLVYMRREIDEAIEKQHFEWAAKLRDMYFKIELVTQRQTVTLPEECTGTFGMIERVQ